MARRSISLSYGPGADDEALRCPGYTVVDYSSDIPEQLRPRFQEMLDRLVVNLSAGQYEELYRLYLPQFATRLLPTKTSKQFSEIVRRIGRLGDPLEEFQLKSVTTEQDKQYGTVYDVYCYARTSDGEKTVESPRTTRMVLRNGTLLFIDLFNLIPD